LLKIIYTKWLQGFKPLSFYKKGLFWLGLVLLSPFLSAQNNYPDFRRACGDGLSPNITLFWSPLSDGCANFQSLSIYGRVDALQPFQLIDSITDINETQYIHFGAKNISPSWSYYIVYKNLCNGDSAYSKILEIDNTQPPESNIDSVSVDINTGKVVVGWSPNPAPDIKDYRVWTSVGANNFPITRVDTPFFVHPASSPNSGTQGYKITALDSCDNQSIINTLHSSIFLQNTYDSCLSTIIINWSAYVGWSNILNYSIFGRSGTIGAYSLLATNNPSLRTYTFSSFIPGDTLEFYIQATDGDNGFTSTSNKISVITRLRRFSNRNYISYATVIDSSAIQLKILGDPTSDTKNYILYRQKGDEGFRKLTDLIYDGTSQSQLYTDNGVEAFKYTYQYRYISEDICRTLLDTSNIAKTMLLSLNSDESGSFLNWNRYGFWNAGIEGFNVYRGFDFGGGFTWNIISPVASTDSSYRDETLPIDVGIAGICYYIEAEEAVGNVYGEKAKSKSNIVCLVDDALIFFPNAFAPNKVNNLFLPIGTNVDYNRTSMLIYARNGQLMKKIDDIRQGWDGTNISGRLCLDGVYLYVCELFGLNEKKYNYKGTIHLLR